MMMLANIGWWQFACREEWTPGSITSFGWDVNVKSMHEEEFALRWMGSLINCCKPNWDVMQLFLKPW